MIRCIALLLLVPSVAIAGYPHGYKLTHNSQGVAYSGGYYTWDAYRCKWNWYAYPAKPNYSTDSHNTQVSYHYTYNFNNASAQAGASQGGLQGAFRYDEFDLGRDEFDTRHYVESAHSLDSKRLANQNVRDVQAGYTRDKLVEIERINAKTRLLQSLDSGGDPPGPQVLQQFNSYSGGTSGEAQHESGGPNKALATGVVDRSALAAAAEAKCMSCHATGQRAGGKALKPFAQFDADAAEAAIEYIVNPDDEHNCGKKAALTPEEHKALRHYLESLKRGG